MEASLKDTGLLNSVIDHNEPIMIPERVVDVKVELEIIDNGRGFDPETAASGGGLGLRTLEERSARLNGSLDIRSTLDEGTSVGSSALNRG